MLADASLVAFVATTQPDLARAFYRDRLGLRLTAEDDFALVFEANGTMLRVNRVQQHLPASYTVLGWHVADIAAAIEDLRSRGVTFDRYPFMTHESIWTAPGGAQVAWFKDPDGNTLSLTQPPPGN